MTPFARVLADYWFLFAAPFCSLRAELELGVHIVRRNFICTSFTQVLSQNTRYLAALSQFTLSFFKINITVFAMYAMEGLRSVFCMNHFFSQTTLYVRNLISNH